MIRIDRLQLRLGGFELRDISFEVPAGRYGVLMGRTGCGKTSVLEAICGLKPLLAGTVELGGRDVTTLRPGERGLGLVPQDVALFGSMTVRDHLAFGPRVHRWPAKRVRETVEAMAAELGIESLLERRIFGLSGGERQRVALGRALALRPGILLLDEPLSALDEDTREQMCKLLKDVQARAGVTTLHVTHSRLEAERLADCVFRFEEGKVVAVSG